MAELPNRPADEDWLAATPEQYERVAEYVGAKYGTEAARDYADWYASRG